MPDMRMMAVTGDPIFRLTGRRSAMVAAGPSPGRTPTAVPRSAPMRHHRTFTGLRATWNPLRRPAKSNTRASFREARRLEHEAPRERGLEQPLEHDVDGRAREEPGRGRDEEA